MEWVKGGVGEGRSGGVAQDPFYCLTILDTLLYLIKEYNLTLTVLCLFFQMEGFIVSV